MGSVAIVNLLRALCREVGLYVYISFYHLKLKKKLTYIEYMYVLIMYWYISLTFASWVEDFPLIEILSPETPLN